MAAAKRGVVVDALGLRSRLAGAVRLIVWFDIFLDDGAVCLFDGTLKAEKRHRLSTQVRVSFNKCRSRPPNRALLHLLRACHLIRRGVEGHSAVPGG
jgi:hypothetical protein